MVSKVNSENYIVIQGFMVNDLKLKGNQLLIYAIIYGFSQAENQVFNGSLQYLADWTNSTKQGVIRCLKELIEKGFIAKSEKILNGVKFCEYYATNVNTLLNKCEYPIKQSLTTPIKQSLPNNIDNNNLLNNIEKRERINYQQIADMYNDICISLPRITTLSDTRKKSIKARLTTYSVDQFKELFTKAEASDFLKGKNQKNWQANFDWLIKDSNFAKVLDGNYENKNKPSYDMGNIKRKVNNFSDAEADILKPKPMPATAGDNENIRARAEALKQQFAERK